jgi:hypothetical protein
LTTSLAIIDEILKNTLHSNKQLVEHSKFSMLLQDANTTVILLINNMKKNLFHFLWSFVLKYRVISWKIVFISNHNNTGCPVAILFLLEINKIAQSTCLGNDSLEIKFEVVFHRKRMLHVDVFSDKLQATAITYARCFNIKSEVGNTVKWRSEYLINFSIAMSICQFDYRPVILRSCIFQSEV